MQNILIVYLLEAKSHLVQTVPAEVLRERLVAVLNDVVHSTLVHELHDDVDIFFPVVEALAVDELIALQMPLQTGFENDRSLSFHIGFLNPFHRELFAVTFSTYQENYPTAAFAEL